MTEFDINVYLPIINWLIPFLAGVIPTIAIAKKKLKKIRNVIDSIDDAVTDNPNTPHDESEITVEEKDRIITNVRNLISEFKNN